jgi:hypothetical protein
VGGLPGDLLRCAVEHGSRDVGAGLGLRFTLPYWVRVSRSGNTFGSYVFSDGDNLVELGPSQTISMAQRLGSNERRQLHLRHRHSEESYVGAFRAGRQLTLDLTRPVACSPAISESPPSRGRLGQ